MRISAELPGQVTRPEADPGRSHVQRPEPGTAIVRPYRARKVLRTVVSVALIAAIFGFAVPQFASYRSVWASLDGMTWPQALLVGTTAGASMASYWFMICAVLPSIRLREAAVVNLGSTAVANTLPAGGAIGMGVSWAMLSSWGVSTADYVLYTLVSGTWNVLARLGLPALALLVLLTATRPDALLIAAAAVGLAVLATAAAGLGLLVRSESFALRAGGALQHVLAIVCRLMLRQPPCDIPGSLLGFRRRAAALIADRGGRITATTAVSHLILWLVLLACLRGVGLSQAQVPWQTSRGFRVRPAADRAAHHPRRSRYHRTRPGRHLGRRRRPGCRRAGDRRRAAVPGRHLPAPYPPRRRRLSHVAARTHPAGTAWATTAGRPQGAGPWVTAR
jgi:hypothetical protein